MAQLININSTEFRRCNLSAIQSGGTWENIVPDENEIILISTKNALTEDGSGNCDAYIIGDGNTTAAGLNVLQINDVSATDFLSLKIAVKTIFDSLGNGAWWGERPFIDFGFYYIRGTITNEGGSPVENANIIVTINGITSTAISDEDGLYEVSADRGSGTITITADGYTQVSEPINIDGNVMGKDFTLSAGYVTDGLIMYLDGSNRGGVAGEWTDVINGVVFTLTNCTEKTDCVGFNGSSSKGVNTDNLATKIGLGDYNNSTIEVVLKPNLANTAQCVFLTSIQSVALQINTNSRLLTTSHGQQAKCYNYAWGTSIFSVSASGTRGVANGTSLTSFNNYVTPAVSNCLGYRLKPEGEQQFFNGDIYAIRIYNRVLSYDEVIKNFNIDSQKYNI